MSSILDALKRLEADGASTVRNGGEAPSWLKDPEMPATASDRLWSFCLNRRIRVALFFTAIIAIAAAAAIWWFPERRQTATGAPAAVPDARVARPHPASGPLTSPEHRPAVAVPAEPAPPDRVRAGAAKPKVPPLADRGVPRSTANKDEPRSLVKKSSSSAGPGPVSTPQPPDPAGTVPTPAIPEPSPLPLPNESGLRLQAISWSPTPAQRIAVINNRVLHEGEQANGFTLSSIRQDTVLLDRSGMTYRLEFQGR